LLMLLIEGDGCLFVGGNGERWLFVCKQSSLTITNNKQTIISHHYHQQTNNQLSPIPSTNKQSSLTITIKKQTVISHHYHQQINNHLVMVRDDCLFVDVNGERWLFGCCC
jgi:hypothetical protein